MYFKCTPIVLSFSKSIGVSFTPILVLIPAGFSLARAVVVGNVFKDRRISRACLIIHYMGWLVLYAILSIMFGSFECIYAGNCAAVRDIVTILVALASRSTILSKSKDKLFICKVMGKQDLEIWS